MDFERINPPNLEVPTKSPVRSYFLKAVPAALSQRFSARLKTVASTSVLERIKESGGDLRYCLTQGVFLTDQERIQTAIENRVSEGEIKEGDISMTDVLDYNRHYWHQLLDKGNVPLPLLRTDDPLQVSYPTNYGQMPEHLGGIQITDYLLSRASNWDEVATTLQEREQEVKETLDESSLAIMSNHSNWLNLPFLIAAMHRVYDIPLDRFHLLLGPALTTFEQGLEAARLANIIKTIPPTPHGQLPPELKKIERKITARSNARIKGVLKTPGNILVYCPFGTTDKKDPNTGELVLDAVDDRVIKFQALINRMAPLMTVGTYDLEAFDGAKIASPGRVNIGMGTIHPKESITLRDEAAQQDVCLELARNVRNYEDKPVGKLKFPTVEIIGSQGKFGAALQHVLNAHFADRCFDVMGVTRQKAESQEARKRPEIIILLL